MMVRTVRIPSSKPLRWTAGAAALLGLALVLSQILPRPEPGHELTRRVPGLDPELARHLVQDSDAVLRAHCDRLDAQQLIDSVGMLADRIDAGSLEGFVASRQVLLPPIERLAAILAERGHTLGPQSLVERQRRSPPARSLRETRLKREISEVYCSTILDTAAKYARIRALADSLRACPWAAAHAESRLVELSADLGRHGRKRDHLRRGIAIAREAGLYPQLSQFLGTFADDRFAAGKVDTALQLADEALAVALDAGLPTQAARVHCIIASYHRGRGEISLAAERHDDAVAVARRFGSEFAEVVALARQLAFQADLGCWDLVGRGLPRMQLLLGRIPEVREEPRQALIRNPVLLLQARYLAHVGRDAAADSVYAHAAQLAGTLPRNYCLATVLEDWSRLAIDRGDGERGLELAREGLAYATSLGLHHDRDRFHAIIARGHVACGRADSAAVHLARARREPPVDIDERFEEWVLALEIAEMRGDGAAACAAADQALDALLDGLNAWGARVEAYLLLQRHDDFRAHLHRRLAAPKDRLALELGWRQLRCHAAASCGQPAAGAVARLLAAGQEQLAALRAWADRNDRVLVYALVGDRILRWQIVAGEVRSDRLPLSAVDTLLDELPPRLAAATNSLPPDLVAALGRAAELLLPPWAASTDGGRLLIVLPEAMAALPLEACHVGSGASYLPLAARWQTAYLRPTGSAAPATARRGSCVVGVPEPSPDLQRRRPSLGSLPRVRAEVALAARCLPDAEVLMDGQALEPTILPRLERSRIVYIAGHATHDPEMPYRSYLPCAAGAGDRDPAHARLTCSDILERDLTGCELVVLSSCRSAAGRATRATVGPSLADVFADAGATGVVAARWGLADAAAADYMERFVDRWRGGDAAAAWDALTAVRRDYLRESAQPSLDWLAYELEFGRLPR